MPRSELHTPGLACLPHTWAILQYYGGTVVCVAHRWSKSSELHEYTGTYHLWALMWVCTLESMDPLEDTANEWYLTFFTFPYEGLTGLLSSSPSWPFMSNSCLVFTKWIPCPSGSILGLSPFVPLLCPWHVLASPYLPTVSTPCPCW